MPVRVTISGTIFEVDTIEDAINIHLQLANGATRSKAKISVLATTNGVSKDAATVDPLALERFSRSLNENGRKIVQTLGGHPEGMTTDQLAIAIGVLAAALPPIIRHVRTMAQRAGLDPDAALRRTRISEQGKPKSRYALADQWYSENVERGV